jgi:RNA polymerase sigma factor (TIGR02999 family)
MGENPPGAITILLLKWRSGDESALDQLVPLVYSELRSLARLRLRRERAGHTLQTGDLIHEAYMRLLKNYSDVRLQDRRHFFAVVGLAMHRVLVDEARRRRSAKRGGAFVRVTIDNAMKISPEYDAGLDAEQLIALSEALELLAQHSPRKAQVIELRIFADMTMEETASVMGLSIDIVKRESRTAVQWLKRLMRDGTAGSREMGEG